MKIAMIVLYLFCVLHLTATIINIPANQPTIQLGIFVAVEGDTILVQPGSYFENINYYGKNITVASLYLTTQDTSYISQTIIDGDNSGSVVTFESGEDSTAVLTGFTITNGNTVYEGGGIYCYQSSPDINNVTITYNDALQGGGIYCEESNPRLDNVTISYNDTGLGFGPAGGGIFCLQSTLTLENVTINGNISNAGGGIFCEQESDLSLTNVTITNNFANWGSGIYCSNSSLSMVNVKISDNLAEWAGGGVAFNTSNPILTNVTIADNSAEEGGGIWCAESNPILTNVTITDNSAVNYGGGIWCGYNANPILVNCIIWNDSPEEIYFSPYDDLNSITMSYSDIEGGETGIVTNNNGTVNWLEGNINVDPLFVGTGEFPYSLLGNSPCVDAGNPDPIYYDPEDPTNPGYALYPAMGTIINDMGAYGGPNVIGWSVVGIDDDILIQTSEVLLHQNYPNPFNPTTTISFSISEESKLELSIFNIKGQKIKSLLNEQISAGEHSIVWNGEDNSEKKVSSGVYLYKLNVNSKTELVKKCLLLK